MRKTTKLVWHSRPGCVLAVAKVFSREASYQDTT
jgi:hypothetical protein